MPGLAFPTDPTYQREYSNDRATPSNTDDIPIDPALAGPVIDPAIREQGGAWNDGRANTLQHASVPRQDHLPSTSQYRAQYSPGPQGDPFALPPPPIYVLDSSNVPNSKPVKRKRKPRREEECGFCQGNDSKNNGGNSELMVTCSECGRSGHPTCMDLGDVADVVRSYSWNCIECKKCEICREKGDDERILFCDFCDRGWHMDCLLPPLNESPPGKWHCPICPPVDFQFSSALPDQDSGHAHLRATSVASTSYSHEALLPPANNMRKDKSKLMFTDESEVDSPISKASRGKKLKGKGRMSDTDQDEAPTLGIRRMKLKVTTPPPSRMVVRLRLPPSRGKGKEREEEEPQNDIFEDILTSEDRDTTRTTIDVADKSRYEKSRAAAEIKLFPPLPPTPLRPESDLPTPGPSSRPLRSSHSILLPSTPGPPASPAPSTPGPGHPASSSSPTSTLRIRTIRFGEFDIQTWYDAPFPEEYANLPDGRLWLCEFCLKYMRSQFLSVRHRTKCKMRHPPGDEIYRDGVVSVFEVDGRKNKIYCQNLCLLSKMFLDHKSLFYDVEPFLFYVITEIDDIGARFVGYFSKEKRSPKDYNVSCIMTLPVRQRKGWGNLLIDFSYLLSKKEQRVGSPEKPLSALGALGYKNYWTLTIMRYLDTAPDKIRLEDISSATGMTIEDICATLIQQGMLVKRDTTPATPSFKPSPGQSIKITRGRKNGVARRHLQKKQPNDDDVSKLPFIPPRDYEITWNKEVVKAYLDKWEAKGYLKLKPERLKWSPFISFRNRKPNSAASVGVHNTTEDMSVDGSTPKVEQNVDGLSSNLAREGSFPAAPELIPPVAPSIPPDSESMEEEDHALASKLASTKLTPVARLKTEDNFLKSETSKTNGKSSSRNTRRSRSQSSKASVTSAHFVPSIEDDEAFAAKLASEEGRARRQLRSRSNTVAQELLRASSIVSSKSHTPARKRRRIESSPEVDSPPVIEPDNDMDRTGPNSMDGSISHEDLIEPQVVPSNIECEKKVNGMNGQIAIAVLDSVARASNSDGEKLVVVEIPVFEVSTNGATDANLDLERPLSELGDEDGAPVTMKGEEGDVDGLVDEDAEGELDVDAEGDMDVDAEGELDMDAEGELDEDAEGEPDDEIDYN